jgi:hypothetical protein
MAVIAVLGGLCAVAVIALAFVVGRLSAQVRQLTGELSALAIDPASPVVAGGRGRPDRPTLDVATAVPDDQARQDEAREALVPVITRLPDGDDDLDVTTRRVASVTLARPLIKVASISYGLRRALDDEHRFKVRYAMRQEFRRQRKMRRRRRAGRAPSMGWRS